MKILFQCNTVYQLLIVLHLKSNLFLKDETSIIISDIMNDSNRIYKNLIESKKFKNVYLQKIKGIKISKFKKIARTKKYNNKILDLKNFDFNQKFDSFFFCSPSLMNFLIYSRLNKKYKTELCFYEDGLATYTKLYEDLYVCRTKGVKSILELHYKAKHASKLYVIKPDIMMWKPSFTLIKIPDLLSINDDEICFINNIFSYKEFELPKDIKTIYFEEGYYGDGKDVNDIEIINKCVDKFGIDGFYIKNHPRNRINRFESMNIKTLNTSSIPWELIVLNNKDKINDIRLITIASAAMYTPNLLFGLKPQCISCLHMINNKNYLYPYIPDIESSLNNLYDNISYFERNKL